jgi:hypothetical protein
MGAIGAGQISNWAGGGATTTVGAATALYGLYQRKKADKLDKNNVRPTYEIPLEIQQNLSQAQQQALQGLPEEQKQQFISNLQRSSAYALSQGSSRRGGLAGISAINQNQNDAYGNLLVQDAGARMQNQQQLYGMRQNMVDYKDKQWGINKENPYYEMVAKAESLRGAGAQNISSGAQTMVQGFQGGGDGGGQRAPQQTQPNYVNNDNAYMRGYQTSQNQNNYYNPNGIGSQSGTMVNDNPYNMSKVG